MVQLTTRTVAERWAKKAFAGEYVEEAEEKKEVLKVEKDETYF